MAAMTKYLLDKVLDHVLRRLPYKFPDQVYLALFTAPVGADERGQEISAKGYSRQPVQFGNKLFKGYLKNTEEIRFQMAEESWGEVVELGLMESQTGPEMLFYGPVGIKKRIEKQDRIIIAPGELAVRIQSANGKSI